MWWDYVKAVVLIIAIIAASYYVSKFIAQKGAGKGSARASIRVTGSRSFGKDRQIIITEIGEKVYILGMTAQSINKIDEFSLEEYEAANPAPPETAAPAPGSFAKEFLERLKGSYKGQ